MPRLSWDGPAHIGAKAAVVQLLAWCRITACDLHSYNEPARVFGLCAAGPHDSAQ